MSSIGLLSGMTAGMRPSMKMPNLGVGKGLQKGKAAVSAAAAQTKVAAGAAKAALKGWKDSAGRNPKMTAIIGIVLGVFVTLEIVVWWFAIEDQQTLGDSATGTEDPEDKKYPWLFNGVDDDLIRFLSFGLTIMNGVAFALLMFGLLAGNMMPGLVQGGILLYSGIVAIFNLLYGFKLYSSVKELDDGTSVPKIEGVSGIVPLAKIISGSLIVTMMALNAKPLISKFKKK